MFSKSVLLFSIAIFANIPVFSQSFMVDIARDSARSDSRTGGKIEKAELEPNNPDLKLTVNVPSFEMTFWQGDNEIKKYFVGVGLKDFPIFVGLRDIDTIIWNPAWIPPDSEWVADDLKGQIIGPADPRNPLGKIKIPLGYGYLIHQAKSNADLGSLVSHGCVRVLRDDLYDLNDKILFANGLDLAADVAKAKKNKVTYVIEIDEPVKLEITYDTIVVENGILSIYPDIYSHKKNTLENLRKELESNGVQHSALSDSDLEGILAKAVDKTKWSAPLSAFSDRAIKGTTGPVVPVPKKKAVAKRKKTED